MADRYSGVHGQNKKHEWLVYLFCHTHGPKESLQYAPILISLLRKTNHKKVPPLKTNGDGPEARTRHSIIFET